MNISEEQKHKFYNLIQKIRKVKHINENILKKRREKERENGLKQPSVISKNNTQNVYNYLYKQIAMLCIKYLFK